MDPLFSEGVDLTVVGIVILKALLGFTFVMVGQPAD